MSEEKAKYFFTKGNWFPFHIVQLALVFWRNATAVRLLQHWKWIIFLINRLSVTKTFLPAVPGSYVRQNLNRGWTFTSTAALWNEKKSSVWDATKQCHLSKTMFSNILWGSFLCWQGYRKGCNRSTQSCHGFYFSLEWTDQHTLHGTTVWSEELSRSQHVAPSSATP